MSMLVLSDISLKDSEVQQQPEAVTAAPAAWLHTKNYDL